MKKLVVLMMVLTTVSFASAQKNEQSKETAPTPITKAELAKSNSVFDLDKTLPKDTKIQTVEAMTKIHGTVSHGTCKTGDWCKSVRRIVDSADAGEKVYFDLKYVTSASTKVQAKALVFKVE